MRAIEGCFCSPLPEGLFEGHAEAPDRLGADGYLLPLSQGALGSSSDNQCGRVSLQCYSITNRCSDAVEESTKCYCDYLEASYDCGEKVSNIERVLVTCGSVCWGS